MRACGWFSGVCRRFRACVAGLLVLGVFLLVGCVPSGVADVLGVGGVKVDREFIEGEEIPLYVRFRKDVALVQQQVFPGEWEVDEYGVLPDVCKNENLHYYSLGRAPAVSLGWRFGGTAKEASMRLAKWLDGEGWQQVEVRHYTEKTSGVIVQNQDLVGHMFVWFMHGTYGDAVTLSAETPCLPGTYEDIVKEAYHTDEYVPDLPVPEVERFDAPPVFGYTEKKEPRVLTEEWAKVWGKAQTKKG